MIKMILMRKFIEFFNKKTFSSLLCGFLVTSPVFGYQPESTTGNQAQADTPPVPQIRLVTSGGFAAAYDALINELETSLGIELLSEYGSSSGGAPDSIPMRLQRGEAFDVIILSRSSLDDLTGRGFVNPDSRIDLVRSIIGMAVREGATIPDISTGELFIKALVDVESIGYSASASGLYLSEELLPELGLWDILEPKSSRILSERVASVVARGEVEIGFQQVSEILPIEGVTFVGPIPKQFQKVTTFSAGILYTADQPEAAARLLKYLSSAALAAQIQESGLLPVVLESR